MCIGRQCLHNRLSVFPLSCTRNFGHIQQMAKLCSMIIPLKAVFKKKHLLMQNIGSQTMGFSQGHFMWFFLKGIFTMLLSSHKHLTAKKRNITSMTSLDILALLSLFMNLVFWGQVAHEHFCNMTWVGYEMALLARGGRHFLVLTTEGSTPPHPIDGLCNDKNWKLFGAS